MNNNDIFPLGANSLLADTGMQIDAWKARDECKIPSLGTSEEDNPAWRKSGEIWG